MADCDVRDGLLDADQHYLAPEKMEIMQFAPPGDLAPFVTQIYFFRCEEDQFNDLQPAALGHLIFLLRGTGHLRFRDGHVDQLHRTAPSSGLELQPPSLPLPDRFMISTLRFRLSALWRLRASRRAAMPTGQWPRPNCSAQRSTSWPNNFRTA